MVVEKGQRDKKVGREGKLTIYCATYSVERYSYERLNASSHAESPTYASGEGLPPRQPASEKYQSSAKSAENH